jgi:D-sedoheptulose 7-phosphate isomerase
MLFSENSATTANLLKSNIENSIAVHNRVIEACLPALVTAADALVAAYTTGHKAVFFGNGGSAADAQHLAAEFVGRYLCERRPLPALALNVNTSAVTGIGNDYGYREVFARQLEALAVPGDVAIALSTSGSSANVVEAVLRARRLGLYTIAFTGVSGGELKGRVDTLIAVPSDSTPRIQECHILAGHALCEVVESEVVKREGSRSISKSAG